MGAFRSDASPSSLLEVALAVEGDGREVGREDDHVLSAAVCFQGQKASDGPTLDLVRRTGRVS